MKALETLRSHEFKSVVTRTNIDQRLKGIEETADMQGKVTKLLQDIDKLKTEAESGLITSNLDSTVNGFELSKEEKTILLQELEEIREILAGIDLTKNETIAETETLAEEVNRKPADPKVVAMFPSLEVLKSSGIDKELLKMDNRTLLELVYKNKHTPEIQAFVSEVMTGDIDTLVNIYGKEKVRDIFEVATVDGAFLKDYIDTLYNPNIGVSTEAFDVAQKARVRKAGVFYIVLLRKYKSAGLNDTTFNKMLDTLYGGVQGFNKHFADVDEYLAPIVESVKGLDPDVDPNDDEELFKRHGVLGWAARTLDNTQMTPGQKSGWLQFAQVAGLLAGAWLVIKKFSSIRKGFFYGILAFIGGNMALNAATGKGIFDYLGAFIYGGLDKLPGVKLNEQQKELLSGFKDGSVANGAEMPREVMAPMVFTTSILGNLNMNDLKWKDGKLDYEGMKALFEQPGNEGLAALVKAHEDQNGVDATRNAMIAGLSSMGVDESVANSMGDINLANFFKGFTERKVKLDEYLNGVQGEGKEYVVDNELKDRYLKYGEAIAFSTFVTVKEKIAPVQSLPENDEPKLNTTIPEPIQDEEVEEEPKFKQIAYMEKDGNVYIVDNDGEAKLLTFDDMSDSIKENLERFPEVQGRIENVLLLLTALVKHEPRTYTRRLEKFLETIENVQLADFENIEDNIQLIDNAVFEAVSMFDDGDNSTMGGISDEKRIWNLFSRGNYEQTRVGILDYIRRELSDSEFVTKQILDTKFEDYTNIPDEVLTNLVGKFENNTITELVDMIFNAQPDNELYAIKAAIGNKGDIEEFIEDVNEKRKDTESYFMDIEQDVIQSVKASLPDTVSDDELKSIMSEQKENIKNSFVVMYMKNLLMEEFIAKELNFGSYAGSDEEIKLYSDIEGIGLMDVSDKSKFWAGEGLKLIATEVVALGVGALTMGVGSYAVNSLVYGQRLGKVSYNMIRASNYAKRTIDWNKWYRKAEFWKIAGARSGTVAYNSVVQGASFYIGLGGVRSIDKGELAYTKQGLFESILFMGGLNILQGFYKWRGIDLDFRIPLSEQKMNITKQLALESGLFAGYGFAKEGILLEPGEWTAQTILQAIMMAGLLKTAGVAVGKIGFKPQGDKVIAEAKYLETSVKKAKEFRVNSLQSVNDDILRLEKELKDSPAKFKEIEAKINKGETVEIEGITYNPKSDADKMRAMARLDKAIERFKTNNASQLASAIAKKNKIIDKKDTFDETIQSRQEKIKPMFIKSGLYDKVVTKVFKEVKGFDKGGNIKVGEVTITKISEKSYRFQKGSTTKTFEKEAELNKLMKDNVAPNEVESYILKNLEEGMGKHNVFGNKGEVELDLGGVKYKLVKGDKVEIYKGSEKLDITPEQFFEQNAQHLLPRFHANLERFLARTGMGSQKVPKEVKEAVEGEKAELKGFNKYMGDGNRLRGKLFKALKEFGLSVKHSGKEGMTRTEAGKRLLKQLFTGTTGDMTKGRWAMMSLFLGGSFAVKLDDGDFNNIGLEDLDMVLSYVFFTASWATAIGAGIYELKDDDYTERQTESM